MSVAGEARRLPLAASAQPVARGVSLAQAALIGTICLLPVALFAPFMFDPFMRDEGVYAATAQAMLRGDIPYRDAFDNKPPMIYAWYGASFLLFGENVWAPRLLASFALSLTTLLVYFEGRLLFSNRFGLVAGVVFAASTGLAVFDTNANTEYFMVLPLMAGILSFTLAGRRDSGWLYAGAGFMSGLSIMTKEVTVFTFVLLLIIVAHRAMAVAGWPGLKAKQFLRPAAWLLAGCAAAGMLTVLPFLLTGSFDDMFDALVIYTLSYVGFVPWSMRLVTAIKAPIYLAWIAGPWAIFSFVGVFRLLRDRIDERCLLLVGWPLSTIIGIVLAGRFYDHYYVALLPSVALLVPIGIKVLRDSGRRAGYAIALTVAVSVFPTVILNANVYLQEGPAERHAAKYGAGGPTGWETRSEDFAAWIRARTSPDDYIYNLGFQSELYFHADRRSPTRFLFDHPFGADDRYAQQAIEELSANPPVYVIDSARYEPDHMFQHYSWDVHDWVTENYVYIGRIYYADVYLLEAEAYGN